MDELRFCCGLTNAYYYLLKPMWRQGTVLLLWGKPVEANQNQSYAADLP